MRCRRAVHARRPAQRDWILKTSITWTVPAMHGTLAFGGVLVREITLESGANAVVPSNNNPS
jgi:hypothetical protein